MFTRLLTHFMKPVIKLLQQFRIGLKRMSGRLNGAVCLVKFGISACQCVKRLIKLAASKRCDLFQCSSGTAKRCLCANFTKNSIFSERQAFTDFRDIGQNGALGDQVVIFANFGGKPVKRVNRVMKPVFFGLGFDKCIMRRVECLACDVPLLPALFSFGK